MPTIHAVCDEFREHRFIMDRLKKALLDKDFSLIVVFPTLSLLHAIQDELLNEPGVSGVGGIRFLLFEGFIKEVGERFGLTQATPSQLVKDLLITEAFESLKQQGKLTYLARAPFTAGYRQAILAGIAEWKRSCLTPDLFTRWAAAKDGKQQQLALLYQYYQHLLVQNGYYEEDLILGQLEQIKTRSNISGERPLTVLYGFTDLTSLQNKFIETLAAWFNFEVIVDPTPAEEIRNFITRRFSCPKLPEVPPQPFTKNALSKLQESFWSKRPEPSLISDGDDSLQIIQTAGWARQATAIAWEMASLLRDNPEYQIDDLLILSPQPQPFLKMARPIFSEYHLPLAVGTTPVEEHPGPNHFSQALATVDSDWQWPEMAVFIRQQYSGELAAEGDRVLIELGERYSALSGKERWHSLLKNNDFHNYFLEKGLNLAPLELGIALLESIPVVASLKAFLESARNYFSTALSAAVQYIISSSTDPNLQLGNLKAIRQVAQAAEEVMAFLDKLPTLTREISLTEFRNFWLSYMSTLEVKAVPVSGPSVRVLVPQEARGIKAKVVFITGLEQGVFPRTYINDWKLSLKDRRELQALGVELETGEQYQTKEKLAFYWAIQTAEERLYLVYQTQDSSGQPLNPSSYLDEVQQYYPELLGRAKCYPLALESPLSLAECCSSLEQGSFLATQLITAATEVPEIGKISCQLLLQNPIYQQLAWQIWQEYIQRIGLNKGLFDELESKQLVAKIFGVGHTFAITALEDYHSCPYRFFLKHLLKVKPLLSPQLLPDNLDLGNLYHQVLQEFAEVFRGQALSKEREQEYRQLLGESFRDFYREWRQNAANDLIKLVLGLQEAQIWGTLQRWLNSELDWTVKSTSRFKIRFLEFGFGLVRGDFDPASLAKPYEFENEGTPIKIWGKVDRIDADNEGNFIVYDYKSGRGPSAKELLQVDYLQIPVYLLALEELYFGVNKAVGGSYLGLKEPSRSRGGVWHADRLKMVSNGKGLLGENEWNDWLTAVKTSLGNSVRAIRNGDFLPTSQECPHFCEYQSCCRRSEREVEAADEVSAE